MQLHTMGLKAAARLDYATGQKTFTIPQDICHKLLSLDSSQIINQATIVKTLALFIRLKRDGYVRVLNPFVMWACHCCRRTVARANRFISKEEWFFRLQPPYLRDKSPVVTFKINSKHGQSWFLNPKYHRAISWLQEHSLNLSQLDIWKISYKSILIHSYICFRLSYRSKFLKWGELPSRVEVMYQKKNSYRLHRKGGYLEVAGGYPVRFVRESSVRNWE